MVMFKVQGRKGQYISY